MTDIAKNRVKTNSMEECRACLAKIHDDSLCVDLFRAWDPPWPGMGVSIAEDLAKLTNIQISVYDLCSKNICKKCCARLQDAINFIWSVQDSDKVLRKRHKDNINEAPLWPKPIQVDKSMASNAMNEMNIEIKQEVVTEDECDMNESNEPIEPRLDIKIEPEEITPAAPIEIEVNGPCGLPNPAEATPKVNGGTEYLDECMVPEVKEEPVSDDEMVPGMPNDCMLCMKTFSSVKELKAHVIALHSYDSVTSSRVNSVNVCKTCNRDFATRTDLFVHETCHSKFACYVCDQKFETFHLLTKHRSKQCMKTSILPRLKTLDDVRRLVPVYYISDKEKPIVNSKPVSPDKPVSPVTEDFIQPSLSYPISAPEQLSNIKSTQESFKETSYITEKTNICIKDLKTERNEKENIEQQYESTQKFDSEKTNAGVKEVGIEINKTLEESIQQRPESIVITCVVEKVLGSKLIDNGSKISNKTEENTIKQESIDISINTVADKEIVDLESTNKSGNNIELAKMTSDTSRIIDQTDGLEGLKKGNLSEAENTCAINNKIEKKTSKVIRIAEDSSKGIKKTDERSSKVIDKMEETVQQGLTYFEIPCSNNDTIELKGNKTEETQQASKINNETKATNSEQIDTNLWTKEQNQVKNCETVLPMLQNMEAKISSSESMKIKLDIYSMDKKQEDAMDIDNDMESDIKTDSSECDKSI